MKTTFLLAGILAATLSRAGDSAPFRLDTRAGIRAARATEPLAYSTDWNSGATGVAIDLDGEPLFSAASPASGDYVWNTDGLPDGLHTLTFNDGVETLDAQFYINPGRIVFDANGGEETMPDFTLFPGAEQTLPESTFTKDGHFLLGWAFSPDGEATLLDGDSTADIVAESGETVTLYAVWREGNGIGGKLLHRWSFNGDLTDSASGQDAVAVGNVTDDGHSYRLAGGSWGNSYINLGSDVLPKDGSPATIEIWATKHSFQRWGRIFDFGTGSNDGDYVFMAWNGEYESDCPFRIYGIGGNVSGLEPYNSNREYHFAMVFEPNSNGTWGITAYKQDSGTGKTLKSVTLSSGNSGWSLPTQGMQTCWLGHSRYSADRDANASYNEVRVWRTALTESELAANALNGPDASIANAYAVRFNANGGAIDSNTMEKWLATDLVDGLSIKYYDISSSGYSTWTQSEAAMTNYFAAYTPTMETNTLAFGETLDPGAIESAPSDYRMSQMASMGMVPWQNGTCRFHGKYANTGTSRFATLLEGTLTAERAGTYSFAALADDYIVLYVDGQLVPTSTSQCNVRCVARVHRGLSCGRHGY